jgi:phosphoglycerate dehydrogenase-like enzyme
VVNVGRGGTLNENDLHTVLQTGKLGGVALDVFEEEPLPEHHWMWTADRLLLTPPWARSLETSSFSWQPLFEENLRRFVNSQELLNVVDKEIGY